MKAATINTIFIEYESINCSTHWISSNSLLVNLFSYRNCRLSGKYGPHLEIFLTVGEVSPISIIMMEFGEVF